MFLVPKLGNLDLSLFPGWEKRKPMLGRIAPRMCDLLGVLSVILGHAFSRSEAGSTVVI